MLKQPILRHSLATLLCVALSVASGATLAHDDSHRPGKDARYPRLSLQAEAVSEVPEDTVEITLAVEIEGTDQTEVARQLAERLNPSMEEAKEQSEVKVRSGGFRVWPSTDRDGKITAWRGRAELILESQNIPAASELAARLSQGMVISSLSFSLSPEARAVEEQRLLKEAAAAFSQRATDAAKAFGFDGYRIHTLNLGGGGTVFSQRPETLMARAAFASDAAMPAPQLEPGRARVTVMVQGEVVLETTK